MSELVDLVILRDPDGSCARAIRDAAPEGVGLVDHRPGVAFDAWPPDGTAPLVAIVDTRLGDPGARAIELSQMAAILGPEDDGLVKAGPAPRGGPRQAWVYPTRLASLLCPPGESFAVAVRRPVAAEVGPVRDVDEPLWDWLIRAAAAGRKLQVFAASAERSPGLERLPRLVPERPGPERDWLLGHLDRRVADTAREASHEQRVLLAALHAGLYQWHDYLDESHRQAQSIEGEGEHQLGDYWHAIMHRREPDYGNAKYWVRQLGRHRHAIHDALRQRAGDILARCAAPAAGTWHKRLLGNLRWDALAFVDFCEACAADEESDLAIAARQIQYEEMDLLFELSVREWHRAPGTGHKAEAI